MYCMSLKCCQAYKARVSNLYLDSHVCSRAPVKQHPLVYGIGRTSQSTELPDCSFARPGSLSFASPYCHSTSAAIQQMRHVSKDLLKSSTYFFNNPFYKIILLVLFLFFF